MTKCQDKFLTTRVCPIQLETLRLQSLNCSRATLYIKLKATRFAIFYINRLRNMVEGYVIVTPMFNCAQGAMPTLTLAHMSDALPPF